MVLGLSRSRVLMGGLLALSAAAYVGARIRAAERHARIARGEIEELGAVRTIVDGRCWYARVGAGRSSGEYLPVVLVHGFGISSAYFVPTAERLAGRFDVYAPDLPGHGRSDDPARPLDVTDLADALRAWMLVMRIDRASLVANSMGCQTAVELAVRYPDVVDRLVLIGPTLDHEARAMPRLLLRFAAGALHERVSMTPLLVRDYLRMRGRLADELRFTMQDRIEDKLPRVAVPVLLMRGEHDHIAPQRWVDELAARTPDARVAVVPGGGHAVHYSAPDRVVSSVLPFLEEARVARPAGIAKARFAGA
ncbi:MAG TPA: alpha/beta hydrolase [Gammaproteobacteria bacterium]